MSEIVSIYEIGLEFDPLLVPSAASAWVCSNKYKKVWKILKQNF